MKIRSVYPSLMTAFALGVGCGGDLEGPNNDGSPDAVEDLVSRTEGDLTVTDVNASELEDWIYMDLETGAKVQPTNPDDSDDWDLAFQRFKVKVNGGSSGTGGVEVAILEGVDFAGLEEAPVVGYVTDRPDGDDEGTIEDYAISIGPSSETGPWNYDPFNHVLSESDFVFVVRSVEGGYFKLRFVEYYNNAGDPGFISFEWAELGGQAEPPADLMTLELAERGFTYVSLRTRQVVEVAEPDVSTDWDIAVQAAAWSTNSGTGRAGDGGARLAPDGIAYDEVTTATTAGYTVDDMIPYPAAPGAPEFFGNEVLTTWFDYDSTLHKASPRDVVFLVRTADGGYTKLQILSYDDDAVPFTYALRVDSVPAADE